jgi:hypothetical protein
MAGKQGSAGSGAATQAGIKVRFFVYQQNGGDGSAIPKFYATEMQARAASERDREQYGENFTDDVVEHEFVIDPSTQEILEGLENPEDTDLDDL